jgi:hypothetical protein
MGSWTHPWFKKPRYQRWLGFLSATALGWGLGLALPTQAQETLPSAENSAIDHLSL